MAKNDHSEFFLTIFPQKIGINSEWPKWLFQIFSDNFPQKDWYKLRMDKNGCSEYFQTIFSEKTGINSEWSKKCTLNLLKPF